MTRTPWTIEPRLGGAGRSVLIAPVAAMSVTVLIGAAITSSLGVSPLRALYFLYIAPFSTLFNFGEVLLKTAPLLLIAQALAIGFRAKIWNVGGEGQLILGAIGGSLLPIFFNDSDSMLMLRNDCARDDVRNALGGR